MRMADVKLQMVCDGCAAVVTFPAAEQGTVQECPHCGGYLDIPEVTRVPTLYDTHTERYERQSEETQRQLEATKRQIEEVDRQQAETRKQIARREALDAK